MQCPVLEINRESAKLALLSTKLHHSTNWIKEKRNSNLDTSPISLNQIQR